MRHITTPVTIGPNKDSIIDANGHTIAFARAKHAQDIALALNEHDELVEQRIELAGASRAFVEWATKSKTDFTDFREVIGIAKRSLALLGGGVDE